MKKILAFSMLLLLVLTAACGNNESSNGSKSEGEGKVDKTELKSQLLDFQLEVISVLKENHKPFAELEAIKSKMNDPEVAPEDKPAKEAAQEKLEAAKAAGPKAAEAIRGMEIPSELSQYEEQLDAALEDAAKSYEKRAENVTVEVKEDAQKEADELFASFEEKIGKVFEDLDLLAPSFKKELE